MLGGVGLNDLDGCDVAEARAKLTGQRRIALQHDDAGSCPSKRLCEDACTPADLDDAVAARELSIGDEVCCELATAEEVLAARVPRGSPPDGHGTSP